MNAYIDTVNKIENMKRFGNKSGREVTEKLLPKIGSPDKGMKIFHIAGTNGKGSVAMYIAAALEANGYKTGLFTSPHLITIRERIQVNREYISEDDFTRLAEQVLSVPMDEEYAPTFFDICLAIALLYFKEQNCDYVVLETGLGGRLDSTRGISETPVVGVITSIGFDHTAILGDTLEKIAGEKAGIIRENMPMVFAHNLPSVIRTLESYTNGYYECDEAYDKTVHDSVSAPLIMASMKAQLRDPSMRPPLLGEFQYDNLSAAFAALEFSESHADVDRAMEGIRTVKWPARIQKISDDPLFIVDGSHNPQGVKALSDTLKKAYPGRKFIFLMAAMADKDVKHMIGRTKSIAAMYLCVKADNPRSMDAETLAGMVRDVGAEARAMRSISDALTLAMELHEQDQSLGLVAFGSLYFAGEILENVSGN
ncbi:MAG: bifunctional folylpolyglutamate synthase/dihydrofolate synthase [Lachnospiraceae bacterium]|nr:bifunctional folylpolyglutamate synthase/dihydrofolate synthase [Lachnospiraceae bacterium]